MLLIDKQFLDTPFYGVRQMTWLLQKSEGPWPQWGRVSPKTAMP
jgi:putative transposase